MSPRFSPGALRVLDELDGNPENDGLIEAIWDVIDLVAEHPNSAQARRRALRTPKGHPVWLVPIPFKQATETWVLLWQPQEDEALIAYIGPDDFRPWRNES
ncbi:hypothetical protein [Micromonospora chersina]|uniref:hypothetical protein n=1 Tax=Micromonospora chersina TaxID=47854 RepID=UPI003716D198